MELERNLENFFEKVLNVKPIICHYDKLAESYYLKDPYLYVTERGIVNKDMYDLKDSDFGKLWLVDGNNEPIPVVLVKKEIDVWSGRVYVDVMRLMDGSLYYLTTKTNALFIAKSVETAKSIQSIISLSNKYKNQAKEAAKSYYDEYSNKAARAVDKARDLYKQAKTDYPCFNDLANRFSSHYKALLDEIENFNADNKAKEPFTEEASSEFKISISNGKDSFVIAKRANGSYVCNNKFISKQMFRDMIEIIHGSGSMDAKIESIKDILNSK